MKDERAIEILDDHICDTDYCYNDCQCCEFKIALDIGKEAIRKNIPKQILKRIRYNSEGITWEEVECPNCKTFVKYTDELKDAKYCLKCGQAWKWDKENKE